MSAARFSSSADCSVMFRSRPDNSPAGFSGTHAPCPPRPWSGGRRASRPSSAWGRRCRRCVWISRSSSSARLRRTSFDAGRAQRMMQVAQAFEHPRFAAAVVDVAQAREPRSRAAGSADSAGITNANRALRSGFSCVDSCVCRGCRSSRRPRARPAPAPGRCSRSPPASGRDRLLLCATRARSQRDRRRRVSAMSRSAENHADFWLGVAARDPVLRATADSSVRARVAPGRR